MATETTTPPIFDDRARVPPRVPWECSLGQNNSIARCNRFPGFSEVVIAKERWVLDEIEREKKKKRSNDTNRFLSLSPINNWRIGKIRAKKSGVLTSSRRKKRRSNLCRMHSYWDDFKRSQPDFWWKVKNTHSLNQADIESLFGGFSRIAQQDDAMFLRNLAFGRLLEAKPKFKISETFGQKTKPKCKKPYWEGTEIGYHSSFTISIFAILEWSRNLGRKRMTLLPLLSLIFGTPTTPLSRTNLSKSSGKILRGRGREIEKDGEEGRKEEKRRRKKEKPT